MANRMSTLDGSFYDHVHLITHDTGQAAAPTQEDFIYSMLIFSYAFLIPNYFMLGS